MSGPSKKRGGTVNCTKCDASLARVRGDALLLKGQLPIEVFAQPGSETAHVICSVCGTLVPLDETMIVLH
jgi:hypothetical protein